MSWTAKRVIRELHFGSSLAVVTLLVFFACTGFMAEHREWFHERIDRADLAEPVVLGTSCTVEAMVSWLGGGQAVSAPSGWRSAAEDGRRMLCREGDQHAYLGEMKTLRPDLPRDEAALRSHFYEQLGGRRDDGGPGGKLPPEVWRWSTVWGVSSVIVDPDRRTYGVWHHPFPVAYALIGIHRGRGANERLLDVTVVLVLLSALTGVLHGLRFGGARRRMLYGFVIVGLVATFILASG